MVLLFSRLSRTHAHTTRVQIYPSSGSSKGWRSCMKGAANREGYTRIHTRKRARTHARTNLPDHLLKVLRMNFLAVPESAGVWVSIADSAAAANPRPSADSAVAACDGGGGGGGGGGGCGGGGGASLITTSTSVGALHQSYHRDRGGAREGEGARERARGRGCEGKERRYQGKCAA